VGNIGTPLIRVVDEVAEGDVLVLEISSYQLEQSSGFRPRIGVLLNLTPDHLHRHGDMREYASAKAKLFLHQTSDDVAILPSALMTQFDQGSGRRVLYDLAVETLPAGSERLLPHEQSNLRAALAACEALLPDFDASKVSMDVVLKAFRLPHRMERIGAINSVHAINDSKSTNAGSTIAALRSLDAPVVLLLGGRHKGGGYESLIEEIAHSSFIRDVILFGEAADALRQLFEAHSRDVHGPTVVATMKEAVDRGLLVSRPGDVLLLSPACSSFDAFTDYAERGDAFSDLIRSVPGFEASTRT
jgi:UDP-N-acetylmuramoylalanine--D-glutamate ligase